MIIEKEKKENERNIGWMKTMTIKKNNKERKNEIEKNKTRTI